MPLKWLNRKNKSETEIETETEISRGQWDHIKELMKEWKTFANVPDSDLIEYYKYKTTEGKYILVVITDYPGYLIGKGGNTIKMYAAYMKCNGISNVEIIERRKVETV